MACCDDHNHSPPAESMVNVKLYKRLLWVALILNAAMFFVEVWAGSIARSLSLWADAIDFAGDAANYGVSLAVLTAAISWRARAAQLKALSMCAFGLYILGYAIYAAFNGQAPNPVAMGAVGFLALIVNVSVAAMLYIFREGDANMRSVWLCSRNDAIGNVAVMLAALGVLGTGKAYPDLIVAVLMASLALHSGWQILRRAKSELEDAAAHKLVALSDVK